MAIPENLLARITLSTGHILCFTHLLYEVHRLFIGQTENQSSFVFFMGCLHNKIKTEKKKVKEKGKRKSEQMEEGHENRKGGKIGKSSEKEKKRK